MRASTRLIGLAALALAIGTTGPTKAGLLLAINDTTNSLIRIDPTTLAVTTVGPTGVTGDFGDLAYNPSSNVVYWVPGRGNLNLYTINQSTGAASLVGSTGIADNFALAYNSSNGKLYAQSRSGDFYSIDPTTAAATLLGNNGISSGGLTYRSDTNQMILLEAGGGRFFTTNIATGSATLLANPGLFVNNSDLTYDPDRNVYWVNDWSNQLYKYDATTFSRTIALSTAFSMDGIVYVSNVDPAVATPEPSMLASAATGVLMVAGYAWNRRKRKQSA
jgi:hypothetical protein